MKNSKVARGVGYTGHPFVDVGVAVLENYLEMPHEEFSEENLAMASKWLMGQYVRKDIKGYLTVHFPNSGWCNPTIKGDKKEIYIGKVLFSHHSPPLEPQRACPFCSRPAQFLADRQHIPMLTGATVLVTAPWGVAGLPVCGYCLLAIQFYPLGTVKVNGRPLFWWTPEPDLTSELVGDMYRKVREILSTSSDKFLNFSWPRTRLLQSASEVLEKSRLETGDSGKPLADCIGYHVTNYGSSPDFDQYFIPKELLEFWLEVRLAPEKVRKVHQWMVQSSWEKPEGKRTAKKKGKNGKEEGERTIESLRNYYYESLGEAFESLDWREGIRKVIPRFFLQKNIKNADKNNFQLCELFLRKVGGMEKQRLEIIKDIADRITYDLILGNNDRRWFKDLYNKEMKQQEFLRYIVRAQKKLAESGKSFSFDNILLLLDISSTEDTGLKDTWLIRSLFLIRILEHLGREKHEVLEEMLEQQEEEVS